MASWPVLAICAACVLARAMCVGGIPTRGRYACHLHQ